MTPVAITTGPAKDSTASRWDSERGKWVHTIRQSTLTSFTHMCPESVRLGQIHPERDVQTSQALIGTAVHAGIEVAINGWLDSEEWMSLASMMATAHGIYGAVAKTHPNFSQNNTSDARCRELISQALEKWCGQVRHLLRPAESEQTFKGLVLHEDDHRLILANGTIDYIDRNGSVWDWKTSSRAWTGQGGKAWEIKRWNMQNIIYKWAAIQIGLADWDSEFVFCVMTHGKDEVEYLNLNPQKDRLNWVIQQALGWAYQNEQMGLEVPWAMNDGGWWCSPKWCNNWDSCKGAITTI